jgi:phage shock protein PspC (stress-responsive transcriptional regulator)
MSEDRNYHDPLRHQHRRARRPQARARLTRARGRRLGGVAAGIADFLGFSPGALRWAWALSLPLTGGLSVLAYLALWALLPNAPTGPREPT